MLSYDRRVSLLALGAGAPAVVISLLLLWAGNYTWLVRTTAALIIVGLWLVVAVTLRDRIIRPLQTVSNLLAALREDDFSIRARGAEPNDALGQVMLEINTLAETLRTQRLGAQEATVLLRAVMAEIDVAIFAFDSEKRLVLVNRYGERLLGRDAADLIGRPADDLGLQGAIITDSSAIQDLSFPGGAGRWEIRRTKFWQGGSPHELFALSDLSQPLREQERLAWRRLIRVIGHELNNSLAPIKSIAGSLESLFLRDPPPDDWRDDMQRGLAVIASRADALSRFTTAYARLARLPAPTKRLFDFGALVRRVVTLESRLTVAITSAPELAISADPDQIEQLLINLVRNAVDAAIETGGGVQIGWSSLYHTLEVRIEDEGPGLQNTGNLFVPFFTTKAGGSGIGLVLSRQIAEGHGGSLMLENRPDGRGTRASLRLPL
ncbi:MAG TPA: ATP-binding protein [Vicinamibacterales bacterium]|jgi:nitrogen fixation/metabolism regulation signal transduction histidine kinase|nr:ATP-binding protein [Vicinamibacterales bacterium]